ncbi:MAG: hypothetical protein QY314_03525 [Candidatus Dojkabacteria bacterium]|nr:MAG: hypothetical protein QY314_03525 [Candidatus Dojkabacteria bacterium]
MSSITFPYAVRLKSPWRDLIKETTGLTAPEDCIAYLTLSQANIWKGQNPPDIPAVFIPDSEKVKVHFEDELGDPYQVDLPIEALDLTNAFLKTDK